MDDTPQAATARRVVVAEDEALIRLDLVEMLRDAGYDVVGEAGDGAKAVELAIELQPDLVVLDVKMPVLDGLSAAEQIGRAALAPCLMLTAFSQTELVERARDAGAMAYLVKPFTAADLVPAIEVALGRWQEIKALEAEVADLEERFETRKRVDRSRLWPSGSAPIASTPPPRPEWRLSMPTAPAARARRRRRERRRALPHWRRAGRGRLPDATGGRRRWQNCRPCGARRRAEDAR